jgi:hypothetical protein
MGIMPEDILTVRLLIGDVEGSPFYPLFDDEEIQRFLTLSNNNVFAAARMAAISASFQLAGWSTRERTGDIEVWNSISSNYLKALDYFIKNPGMLIPSGLMPWSANRGCPSKLLTIQVCDDDDKCCTSGCDSSGKTF